MSACNSLDHLFSEFVEDGWRLKCPRDPFCELPCPSTVPRYHRHPELERRSFPFYNAWKALYPGCAKDAFAWEYQRSPLEEMRRYCSPGILCIDDHLDPKKWVCPY